jgi:glycosyltransferase involved in cell wall biosynthesis
MRILYLHQFFTTRAGVGSTRSYEFARRFVEHGHSVRMVTAARQEQGQPSEVDGIEVVTVRGGFGDYVHGTKIPYPRRALEFLRFAFAASLAVLRGPRPDVVYATSPPLTVAIPALLARARHRAPLVFEVRDLWPEGPIQMGILTNPLLVRLARSFEALVYRSAERVIALSPGMREGVLAAGGLPQEKVTVVPNASDLELFSPDVDGAAVRERLGLGDRFVCSYLGTMGQPNDVDQAIEAAHVLNQRGDDGVVFLLMGDGKRRPQLERLARDLGADNVRFYDPIADKGQVAQVAAASNACMTLLKDLPVLRTSSPNKLFDTLAAGRPAVVNVPGWLQRLVEDHDAGVYARPGDAADLADKVAFLRDHPELAARYGRNARRLAEREFSRDALAEHALSVLEAAAARD